LRAQEIIFPSSEQDERSRTAKESRSKNAIRMVATSIPVLNTDVLTVDPRWSSLSFLNVLRLSGKEAFALDKAVLSLIDKVVILPERAPRLQTAGMMQGV